MSWAEEFWERLKAYREPRYGLLGDGPHPTDPSGNALLYEAHAAYIGMDRSRVYNAAELLQVEACHGLFNRKPPPATDPQAHDDYTGLAAVVPFFADMICRRGEDYGWFYDNNRPEVSFWKAIKYIARGVKGPSYLKYWHARLPGQIQHYKIASLQRLSPLGWLLWLGSILWTIRKPGNESGWLLDYLKLRCALERFPHSLTVRFAAWIFKKQLAKHYGANIAHVYAVYFGPQHPFAQYASWPER